MSKRINFEIESAEIEEENPDSQFVNARIAAFSTGETLNNTTCDLEDLKRTSTTIYEKPIIFEINKNLQDFGSHNDGITIPAGFVSRDSAEFKELPDGRVQLSVLGKIWRKYSGKFIDIFRQDNKKIKKVSVEVEVYDSETTDAGLMKMKDWAYCAICVLGDLVVNASKGAEIELMSFAAGEKEEYKEAYFSEFGDKYSDIDFGIPQKVKENAINALNIHKEKGIGINSVLLSIGRFLSKSDFATPEKIRQIAKRRYKNNKDKTDYDTVSIGLCGGLEGLAWAKEVVDKMDEKDNEQLAYFGQTLTFPYKSREDMNPALRGIEPPITTSQANEIARQADAIGGDYGWPTAIKSWKSRHVVKDGRWVKKENMEEEKEFAKEDLGKGSALKVDKSKDKMSSSPWSNVDKTSLMHKILNASNYKSLIHDVYLLVEDGWEEHPSSSLKYPVMQISDGTLVYNRGALGNALARATQQNENGVVSKINGIYKKLGIGSQKEEMSVEDEEKVKEEEMAAEKPEEEKPEEEEKETPEEEKKEEKMSLDANLDVAALLAMLQEETEDYKEVAEEFSKPAEQMNYSKVMYAMYAKMCKMAEACGKFEADAKAYMAENEELKKFKADIEKERFQFEVDSTMKEIENAVEMSKEQVDALKEESKSFSINDIGAWKNKAKAIAFSCPTKKNKEDNAVKSYGLPWGNVEKTQKKSIWE